MGLGSILGKVAKGALGVVTGNPGAVISAGASLAGGLIGAKSSENINKAQIGLAHEQMDWNERMMDKQNDWNLEQWNRQNEYNTPSAQRQRLEDAGMNPIFYGLDGNGNGGALSSATANASSMPQLQNPGLSMQAALTNIGNVAADTELKKAQANNLNSGAGLTDEQAETERQLRSGKVKMQNVTITFTEEQTKRLQELTPAEVRQIDAATQKINTEISQMPELLRLAQNKDAREEALKQIAQSHLDNETKRIQQDFIVAMGHLANDTKRTEATVALQGAELVIKKHEGTIKGVEAQYAGENARNSADILKYQANSGYRSDITAQYEFGIHIANNNDPAAQFVDSLADAFGRFLTPLRGILGSAVDVSRIMR
ncbi:DNA pilot protein [Dipodfec virus UOA04_Rod_575]|nr:DNA pilot protein [Dipodfec virus UOA04_Rod_575]